jgi:hypothetical protein
VSSEVADKMTDFNLSGKIGFMIGSGSAGVSSKSASMDKSMFTNIFRHMKGHHLGKLGTH